MMKTWTSCRAFGLAALLALAACEDHSPGFVMEPEVAESEAATNEHSPEMFYRMIVSAPPHSTVITTFRPAYYTPRFYRFRSELAKRRFLSEALGPVPDGWRRTLEPMNEGSLLPLVDVWVSSDGRGLHSMLVNPLALPNVRWQPRNADRDPGGVIWTH